MILKSGSIIGLAYPKYLSIVLIFLLLAMIRSINIKYILNGFILIIFLILHMLVTGNEFVPYVNFIFHIVVIMIATIVFCKKDIIEYVKPLLYFIILHSLISYFVLFLPLDKTYLMDDFSTIGYMFYYGESSLSGNVYRNQGLFWEPGILQFYINLYIFILLFVETKVQKLKLFFSSLALILTFSSTGYIIYFLLLSKKYIIFRVKDFLLIIIPILMLSILIPNLIDKFIGESSISGFLRILDFYVPMHIFIDNFVIGVGLKVNEAEYYIQYLYNYGADIFELLNMPSDYFLKLLDEERLSTNSFIVFLAAFGTLGFLFFMAILNRATYIFTTKNNFLLMLIFLLTFLTEPIMLFNFFLFFYLLSYNDIMSQYIYKKPKGDS